MRDDKLPRHEIRRMVSEEALARIDELEDACKLLKERNNRQARAMEAIANAVTGYALDLQALEQRIAALERPIWRRALLAVGHRLQRVSASCELWLAMRRRPRRGRVTVTHIHEDRSDASLLTNAQRDALAHPEKMNWGTRVHGRH